MKRLLATMKLDITVQLRNQLYAIGIFVGILSALALGFLAKPDQLRFAVPTVMLLAIGGSTLFYVAGMILFEKDEGTLNATIITPLRLWEYLWSKIITLTALATFESIIMISGAMLIMYYWRRLPILNWPDLPLLFLGIIAIGIIYTLIGIILIVRYDKITDFLIPMAGIAVLLQLPFLYFLGMIEHPLLLAVPTSAPAVIMQGAYSPLPAWQWLYAAGYTLLIIVLLTLWAYRAFNHHIIVHRS